MSEIKSAHLTCALCGATSEQKVLVSENLIGNPYLDGRESIMDVGGLAASAQLCPCCGYAAQDISQPTTVSRACLQDEAYRTFSGLVFSSAVSKSYYRQYLLNLADPEAAYQAIIRTAWSCDDAGETENAQLCRKLALEQLEKQMEQAPDEEFLILLRAELLRRTGSFEQLVQDYCGTLLSNEFYQVILEFQLQKAAERDDGCYQLRAVAPM